MSNIIKFHRRTNNVSFTSFTSLLLTGDDLLDHSPNNPKTLTVYGNTAVNTTTKKFGTGSIYFDGTGDYVGLANSADFNFGTGDFTIEMWLYVPTMAKEFYIIYSDGGSNCYIAINKVSASAFKLEVYNTVVDILSTATNIATGVWNHLAISKTAGNLKMFINGTLDSTTAQGAFGSATNIPLIGESTSYTGQYQLAGYIDDLRITKGVARYTANFTPPTQALPIS